MKTKIDAMKRSKPLYACIIKSWVNGHDLRSSFFSDLNEAIAYAERMPGVKEIESIGVGIVWTRPESE